MSSFKKADGMIDSIQKQATGLRTLDGSAIEDFLSIAGYEDPAGGGGGGGGDFKTYQVTLDPQESLDAGIMWYNYEQKGSFYDETGWFNDLISHDGTVKTATLVTNETGALKFTVNNEFVSATGDASYDNDTGILSITGDCSLVINQTS